MLVVVVEDLIRSDGGGEDIGEEIRCVRFRSRVRFQRERERERK